MKLTVNEVLKKLKGDKENEVLYGKAAFSKSKFDNLVHSMVNDPSYEVSVVGKDGNESKVNLSKQIRESLKKTIHSAGYPQKSEIDNVIDTCEIKTDGFSDVLLNAAVEWLGTGRKLDLPSKKYMNGSLYFTKVPAKDRTVTVRDIKNHSVIGSSEIKTKEYIRLMAKSPVPAGLQTKVRKDLNGNIIK